MTSSEARPVCTDSRKKILEYRWEKLRKKILEDCLWQVTKDELEALEACYWLKATGFQEYVHMYEDQQFPIEVSVVLVTHGSLDQDSSQSLIRRLETLNRCAKLLEKRVSYSPPLAARLRSNTTQLRQQCGVANPLQGTANGMSDHSSSISENRKRPSSKYGIFDIQSNACLDNCAGPRDGANVDTTFSRTYSFSGTRQSSSSQWGRSTSRSTSDVIQNNSRLSVYDNVPMAAKNPSNAFFQTSDMSQNDSVFDESVGASQTRFVRHLESDDDLSSVSSAPEYDDDFDAVDNQAKPIITDVCSSKVMGSVDSGVPSSPFLRSPSVRKRRVRWHSFHKSSERASIPYSLRIQNLSAGQLYVLKKLSLLRLTALIERHSVQSRTGWHWTVPKLLRKLKSSDSKEKGVFGASLLTMVRRTGLSLPRSILLSMNHLTRTSLDKVGIFRRSGMKSRIEKLKEEVEDRSGKLDFESYSPYDIADMLKLYLRELPEPLLTSKLAETFISIYKDIPKDLQEEAMQLAMILMPDENREALQTILAFLNEFAAMSAENQMDYKNLSVCFTPAFFHVFGFKSDKIQSAKRLKRSFNSQKSEKDLEDTSAAQRCLEDLIKSFRILFTVPEDLLIKCQFSYIEQGDPVSLEQFSSDLTETEEGGYQLYIDNCFAGLLQESHAKAKGWVQYSINDDVEITYKVVKDGYPIRLWKAVVEINACAFDAMRRFVKERHLWDDQMIHWEYVENIDEQTDIFYYETQNIAPSIKRDYLTLRSWRKNLNGACCGCVSTSINHKGVPTVYGYRATVLADRCFMEPCGLGRCKLTYISRTDLRGKSPRYYNKAVGAWLVYSCVTKIRESFNCGPDGPETNV